MAACACGRGLSPYRTSEGAWLSAEDDPILEELERKIADVSGLPASHGEVRPEGHDVPHLRYFIALRKRCDCTWRQVK